MYNPRFLKVEGHSYLLRDTTTNAIVNTDKKGHEQYLALKRAKSKEIDKVKDLEEMCVKLNLETSTNGKKKLKNYINEIIKN